MPSSEELIRMAKRIAVMTAGLSRTAGLSEGHVERLAVSIEKILKDYGGASYRQYRNLVRDCDAVAGEVARLGKAGALHPKYVKVLDAALLRIRKRDLFQGRQLVNKLAKPRALAEERDRLLAEYREGYKEIEREVARLKAERDRLRSVRKPPVAEGDVERVKGLLDAANRFLAGAVTAELHAVPSRLALAGFLEASRDRRLVLPAPSEEDARPLLDLLDAPGPVRETFGDRGVHALLEALAYSDAKLAHKVGDGRPLRAALNANLPWLKALTAPGNLLPQLSLDLPIEDLRSRVEALGGLVDRLHSPGEAKDAISAAARSLESGEIQRAQEADRLYRTFGDAARNAWAGTLATEIHKVETDLSRHTKDLAGLTSPDRLL